MIIAHRSCLVGAAALLLLSADAVGAKEVKVMSSGGLTAAFQAVLPDCEKATGDTVELVLGPSMGTWPEAIPSRLSHGESADVVLMVGSALGDLVSKGMVDPASRVDVANSRIGLAVKAGAPTPDISTVEALKRTLLAAKSIAYSDSASGVYIEREMYKKLGLEDALKPKSRMIVAERVGNVVARGEAELGFQQVAELLPVQGITYMGTIPDEVQSVTTFSAGIPANAKDKEAGKALIACFTSAQERPALVKSGLEPIGTATPTQPAPK